MLILGWVKARVKVIDSNLIAEHLLLYKLKVDGYSIELLIWDSQLALSTRQKKSQTNLIDDSRQKTIPIWIYNKKLRCNYLVGVYTLKTKWILENINSNEGISYHRSIYSAGSLKRINYVYKYPADLSAT